MKTILPVKPGSIRKEDWPRLAAEGILVIEHAGTEDLRLIPIEVPADLGKALSSFIVDTSARLGPSFRTRYGGEVVVEPPGYLIKKGGPPVGPDDWSSEETTQPKPKGLLSFEYANNHPDQRDRFLFVYPPVAALSPQGGWPNATPPLDWFTLVAAVMRAARVEEFVLEDPPLSRPTPGMVYRVPSGRSVKVSWVANFQPRFRWRPARSDEP